MGSHSVSWDVPRGQPLRELGRAMSVATTLLLAAAAACCCLLLTAIDRERLNGAARAHRVALWESEGVTLDERFLALDGVLTATTLRDPVDRAVSMYW